MCDRVSLGISEKNDRLWLRTSPRLCALSDGGGFLTDLSQSFLWEIQIILCHTTCLGNYKCSSKATFFSFYLASYGIICTKLHKIQIHQITYWFVAIVRRNVANFLFNIITFTINNCSILEKQLSDWYLFNFHIDKLTERDGTTKDSIIELDFSQAMTLFQWLSFSDMSMLFIILS